MLLIFNIGYSQSFYSNLKATGLTCAMCSYSTQKSLEKLDFIESITPDLEATSFVRSDADDSVNGYVTFNPDEVDGNN